MHLDCSLGVLVGIALININSNLIAVFSLRNDDMVQILDSVVNVDSACYGFDAVVRVIKDGVFPIIQIVIPIILLVLCTFDLGKAVIGSDDKENKKLLKRIVRRLVYAILIFFFITVLNLIFTMVGSITENDTLVRWSNCWNYPMEN